jgi:hypothetical protein
MLCESVLILIVFSLFQRTTTISSVRGVVVHSGSAQRIATGPEGVSRDVGPLASAVTAVVCETERVNASAWQHDRLAQSVDSRDVGSDASRS